MISTLVCAEKESAEMVVRCSVNLIKWFCGAAVYERLRIELVKMQLVEVAVMGICHKGRLVSHGIVKSFGLFTWFPNLNLISQIYPQG